MYLKRVSAALWFSSVPPRHVILIAPALVALLEQFLVFQLSVNLVAMISAAVGALYGGVPPLNVLQLLWVNMIM